VEYTTWEGWLKLEAHEAALGAAYPDGVVRERIKVVPRPEMVHISRGGLRPPCGAGES